jgi:outer membrane receptor protein involved in Fe transport
MGAEVTFNSVRSHSFETDNPDAGTDIPTTFNNEGVYAEVESTPAPWITLTAGLRYDVSSLFENRFSPRAGLLLHSGDLFGLKLLIAEGFRNPSPFEAFFADNSTSEANPNLKPESITSYEAVLWGRPLPGLNLRGSVFWWQLTDMLQQLPDPDTSFLQFNNVNEIRSIGAELEGSYRTVGGWYGFASLTYADVGVLQPDGSYTNAPNAPHWVVSGGVSTPRIAGLLHISTELQFISERDTRDPTVTSPAFTRWNAALVFPSWHKFDLTLGVRNILGTREQVPAQGDFDRNYPQPDGSTTTFPVNLLPGEGTEIYARLGYSY